jgi:hypothetical protein
MPSRARLWQINDVCSAGSFLNRAYHLVFAGTAANYEWIEDPSVSTTAGCEQECEKAFTMQIRNQTITGWAVGLALLASMAGWTFGYDTGQISGFLVMPDFLRRFGNCEDPNNPTVDSCKIPVWREGTIIALLSVGTLFGALLGAPMADYFGRVSQRNQFNNSNSFIYSEGP